MVSDEFIGLLPENDIPNELVTHVDEFHTENVGSNTSPGSDRDGNIQVVTEDNLVTPGFNMGRTHYSLLGNEATIDIGQNDVSINQESEPFLLLKSFLTLFPDSTGNVTGSIPPRTVSVLLAEAAQHYLTLGYLNEENQLIFHFAGNPLFSFTVLDLIERERAARQVKSYFKNQIAFPRGISTTDWALIWADPEKKRNFSNHSLHMHQIFVEIPIIGLNRQGISKLNTPIYLL